MNPKKSNIKKDKAGTGARRAPSRFVAPQSKPGDINGVKPAQKTVRTEDMPAGTAYKTTTPVHIERFVENTQPNQPAQQNISSGLNPREQLRRLQIDSDKTEPEQRNVIPVHGGSQSAQTRAIKAPLPREIEYETPEIDPEVLRRSAALKRADQVQKRSGAPTELRQTNTEPHDVGGVIRPVVKPPSKPLPHKTSDSAPSVKLRRGYKRADEFLPDKPIVTGDRRVISKTEGVGYIQGRDVLEEPSEQDDPGEPRQHGTALTSLLKAVIYIVFILTASAFLSYFTISVGNDVFAFIKSTEEITIYVPAYSTLDNIADLLTEKGLIKYPFIFKIYSTLRKDDGNFLAGEYTVNPSMNYDQLRYALKGTTEERKQISITIPEGYTVDEIIDLFVNTYGMGTREGFVDAIQNEDFDYWFLENLEIKEGRKYRLEGYLYPDTYYFFTDWSEKSILNKFLSNFETKFDESYLERCEELGMTVDELITLASMIEMEGKYTNEYGQISAVFHNRLNNTSMTNGKLESDATIQYVLPERHEELTVDDLAIDSRYNTYKYSGLPPGPITNPTLNAIHSAMFPDNVDYLYFVSRPNGQTLFAKTYEEHLKNKQEIAAEKAGN